MLMAVQLVKLTLNEYSVGYNVKHRYEIKNGARKINGHLAIGFLLFGF
jgi:hypothetical protein